MMRRAIGVALGVLLLGTLLGALLGAASRPALSRSWKPTPSALARDYVIINDTLERAFAEVQTILAAERMKRARQPWISTYVRRLRAKL